MASSKIIDTGYPCVELAWNRKKAKSVFNDLKEIAQNYKCGVDEEQEFYFQPISNTITKRYWIGKGVKLFEPDEEVDPIINEYDVLVGQMTSGDNYLLTVKDDGEGSSQEKFGIRRDNLQLPECIPGFGSDLASGKTPTTNPVAGTPANMTNGNSETEWDSGENQEAEDYIQVDLGEEKSYLGKIRVDSINSAKEKNYSYADRFKVLISSTGAFTGEETEVFAAVEDFGTADVVITFVPTTGRYMRIELTAGKAYHWRVNRFEVFEWQVGDITRWAIDRLNKTKDPIKRGVLELEVCYEKLWPQGKIRLTSQDGGSYYDYPHVATSVHVGTERKIEVQLELGEVKKSVGDQILAQRRMISEFGIAGLSRDADLSSGAGLGLGGILHTHIGKDSIETPMLRAGSIYAKHYHELRNTYVFSDQESLDAAKSFEMDFEIVSEMTAIVNVKLSFRIKEFRAYATTVPSGGGHTTPSGGGHTTPSGGGHTTPSGGGATSGAKGSASGGGSTSGYEGTPSGGGSTSGGGGATTPTSSVDSGGYASVWRILQAYLSHGVGVELQEGWLIQDYDTLSLASHTHTHTVTLSNHTHSTPNHTHPNHRHSTPNHTHPNHTHTTPAHTHTVSNHQHTVSSHTHTVSNHTHSLTFGIYEASTSPTINVYVSNDGINYGDSIGAYEADELDLVITGISGAGWKRIKFTSNVLARISAIIMCKVDITA